MWQTHFSVRFYIETLTANNLILLTSGENKGASAITREKSDQDVDELGGRRMNEKETSIGKT